MERNEFDPTLYSVLEIPESASPTEIREAYLFLVQVWHPDQHHSRPKTRDKATERMKAINAAYETLIDSARKDTYDTRLKSYRDTKSPRDHAYTPPGPAASHSSNHVANEPLSFGGAWTRAILVLLAVAISGTLIFRNTVPRQTMESQAPAPNLVSNLSKDSATLSSNPSDVAARTAESTHGAEVKHPKRLSQTEYNPTPIRKPATKSEVGATATAVPDQLKRDAGGDKADRRSTGTRRSVEPQVHEAPLRQDAIASGGPVSVGGNVAAANQIRTVQPIYSPLDGTRRESDSAGGSASATDGSGHDISSTRIGGGVYRIGGDVSAPSVLFKVDPEYSEEARKAKFEGTMVLSFVVDEKGNPKELKVIRALGLGLDQKAIEAVEKWKFRPGLKDGHAVSVFANIAVNFRLLPE